MKCDACGKEISHHGGATKYDLIGAVMKFTLDEGQPEDQRKYCQKQLGKYKINKQYNICWECLLKAYKVKP